MSKDDQYREILDRNLQVFMTKKEDINRSRLKKKEEAIEWTIRELHKDFSPVGSKTELQDAILFFGTDSWKAMKDCVLLRDDGKCRVCGNPAEEVHHIRPRHFHGTDVPANLVSLCKTCHDEVHRRISDKENEIFEYSMQIVPAKHTTLEEFL